MKTLIKNILFNPNQNVIPSDHLSLKSEENLILNNDGFRLMDIDETHGKIWIKLYNDLDYKNTREFYHRIWITMVSLNFFKSHEKFKFSVDFAHDVVEIHNNFKFEDYWKLIEHNCCKDIEDIDSNSKIWVNFSYYNSHRNPKGRYN